MACEVLRQSSDGWDANGKKLVVSTDGTGLFFVFCLQLSQTDTQTRRTTCRWAKQTGTQNNDTQKYDTNRVITEIQMMMVVIWLWIIWGASLVRKRSISKVRKQLFDWQLNEETKIMITDLFGLQIIQSTFLTNTKLNYGTKPKRNGCEMCACWKCTSNHCINPETCAMISMCKCCMGCQWVGMFTWIGGSLSEQSHVVVRSCCRWTLTMLCVCVCVRVERVRFVRQKTDTTSSKYGMVYRWVSGGRKNESIGTERSIAKFDSIGWRPDVVCEASVCLGPLVRRSGLCVLRGWLLCVGVFS